MKSHYKSRPDMIICAYDYKKMYTELFLVNKFGKILRICLCIKYYQLFNGSFSKDNIVTNG